MLCPLFFFFVLSGCSGLCVQDPEAALRVMKVEFFGDFCLQKLFAHNVRFLSDHPLSHHNLVLSLWLFVCLFCLFVLFAYIPQEHLKPGQKLFVGVIDVLNPTV
jgi:hypothetical protein